MSDLPLGPLPEEVRVSLVEIGAVVAELERMMRDLASQGQMDTAERIDALVATDDALGLALARRVGGER